MNKDLVSYVKNVLHLREVFSLISHINMDAEAMKIWARWIITHRSLCPQSNIYLPNDDVYDCQLLLELQDKGVSVKHSLYLNNWLIDECRKINNKFNMIALTEYGGIHGDVPVLMTKKNRYVVLTCNGMAQEFPLSVYNRLVRLYRQVKGIPIMCNNYIWLCATLYSLLDGKGLQWAAPPKVMNILQRDLGCHTELFASPINAYGDNSYYSLFMFDKAFGSKGNFFTAKDSDFVEGTYQVNPPFIDPLFTKTTERILELLDIADRNNKELTFIYIMPEWKDFVTYNMVSEARFCVKQILLPAFTHYYYQCTDLPVGSYIRARFGSHVFFLSTNPKCCPYALEREIRQGFSSWA